MRSAARCTPLGASVTHRSSAHPRPQTFWEWGPALAVCAIFVCACLAGVLSIHLSLEDRHRQGRQPIVAERRSQATAQAGALPPGTATGGAATGAGSAAQLQGSGLTQATASQGAGQGAGQAASVVVDQRLSDQAEKLSEAELHGGWRLTWEVGWHFCHLIDSSTYSSTRLVPAAQRQRVLSFAPSRIRDL